MSLNITIALTEDNAINRNTFRQKISNYPHLQLVFTAVNGHECLQHLKLLPVKDHPQVIFVDLEMPELDGIQTIQLGKKLYPHIHFIVLTVFDDDEKIFEAIRAGAAGYLLKDETAAALLSAIENVVDFGGAPLSPAIARKALNLLSQANVVVQQSSTSELDSMLSEREKEILQYTIQGYDARRVADMLFISVLTVRKHIANIYERLHVNSKAQVINLAHQRKWFNEQS
jgi:DNA-binding NarL/FixJ family response regulator